MATVSESSRFYEANLQAIKVCPSRQGLHLEGGKLVVCPSVSKDAACVIEKMCTRKYREVLETIQCLVDRGQTTEKSRSIVALHNDVRALRVGLQNLRVTSETHESSIALDVAGEALDQAMKLIQEEAEKESGVALGSALMEDFPELGGVMVVEPTQPDSAHVEERIKRSGAAGPHIREASRDFLNVLKELRKIASDRPPIGWTIRLTNQESSQLLMIPSGWGVGNVVSYARSSYHGMKEASQVVYNACLDEIAICERRVNESPLVGGRLRIAEQAQIQLTELHKAVTNMIDKYAKDHQVDTRSIPPDDEHGIQTLIDTKMKLEESIGKLGKITSYEADVLGVVAEKECDATIALEMAAAASEEKPAGDRLHDLERAIEFSKNRLEQIINSMEAFQRRFPDNYYEHLGYKTYLSMQSKLGAAIGRFEQMRAVLTSRASASFSQALAEVEQEEEAGSPLDMETVEAFGLEAAEVAALAEDLGRCTDVRATFQIIHTIPEKFLSRPEITEQLRKWAPAYGNYRLYPEDPVMLHSQQRILQSEIEDLLMAAKQGRVTTELLHGLQVKSELLYSTEGHFPLEKSASTTLALAFRCLQDNGVSVKTIDVAANYAWRLSACEDIAQTYEIIEKIPEILLTDPRIVEQMRKWTPEYKKVLLQFGNPTILRCQQRVLERELEDLMEDAKGGKLSAGDLETLTKKSLQLYTSCQTSRGGIDLEKFGNNILAMAFRCLQANGLDDRIPELPVKIDSSHALSDLLYVRQQLEKAPGNRYWIHVDSSLLRGGVARLSFNQKKEVKITATLPQGIRSVLGERIEQIRRETDSGYSVSVEDSGYQSGSHRISAGPGFVIRSRDGRITFKVGANEGWWNQYEKISVEVSPSVSAEELSQFLIGLGLGQLMLDARPEDLFQQRLARLAQATFPSEQHQSIEEWAQRGAKDPDLLARAKKMTVPVGSDLAQEVDPMATRLFMEAGGIGFGMTVGFGRTLSVLEMVTALKPYEVRDVQEGAGLTTARMCANGCLSTVERYERGLFGEGCCADKNLQTGSANQVYARALTQNQLDGQFDWSQYAIPGSVFLLVKPQAAERLPYCYPSDYSGLRSPSYHGEVFHVAQKEWPSGALRGQNMVDQIPLPELARRQQERGALITAEVMFEQEIGRKYVVGMLVKTDQERAKLIEIMKSHIPSVTELNGVPIEECIIVATTFNEKVKRLLQR